MSGKPVDVAESDVEEFAESEVEVVEVAEEVDGREPEVPKVVEGEKSKAQAEIGEWAEEYFRSCPEGCKFSPTDQEIVELLVKKEQGEPLPLDDCRLYNLYSRDPYFLASRHSEDEKYYLTKQPMGEEEVGDGLRYWKATEDEAEVHITSNGQLLGYRKTLDNYTGEDGFMGVKTGWKMHEYRLHGTASPNREDAVDSARIIFPPNAQKKHKYVICKVFYDEESDMRAAARCQMMANLTFS